MPSTMHSCSRASWMKGFGSYCARSCHEHAVGCLDALGLREYGSREAAPVAASSHLEAAFDETIARGLFRSGTQRGVIMLANATLQTLILSSRMTEAETFYSNTLGLPLIGRSHGALIYAVGSGQLRVCPVPDWQPSSHTAVGFAV